MLGTKQEAIDWLHARYDIDDYTSDGFVISSGGSQTVRLISQSAEGDGVSITSDDAAVIGYRYTHQGNMNHPPDSGEEIIWELG